MIFYSLSQELSLFHLKEELNFLFGISWLLASPLLRFGAIIKQNKGSLNTSIVTMCRTYGAFLGQTPPPQVLSFGSSEVPT